MYSGACAATIGVTLAGVATVTSPAPDRSAPRAARIAAPLLPRDPATIRTRPKSPLCASDARGLISGRIRSRVSSSSRGPSSVVEHLGGNADVGDHDLAATSAPPAAG